MTYSAPPVYSNRPQEVHDPVSVATDSIGTDTSNIVGALMELGDDVQGVENEV